MNEGEISYAVRLRRYAQADVDEAFISLADAIDVDYATAWLSGLRGTLAKLATFPKRWLVVKTGRFRQEVRVVPYRYNPGGVTYLVHFLISEAEDDAPTVYILHVRHGARKPISLAEARKIEAED